MSHLRRVPKQFNIAERIIYLTELEHCPACGAVLYNCNHYAWTKTVQQLERVISVASRPKECRNATCCAYGQRFFSATAQTVALPNSTYGLDVIAQLGFYRDFEHLSGQEIFERLRSRLQISRRQIDL